MTKKEAELEIKRLIAGFDEDEVNYRDFKTPREYMVFREVRCMRLLAEDAEKAISRLNTLAAKKSIDTSLWVDAFVSHSVAVGSKSLDTYKLYVSMFKKGEIPESVQLPLLLYIYTSDRVNAAAYKYIMAAYKKYPLQQKNEMRIQIVNELKDYTDTDGYITVYRGEFIDAACGSSININRAVSFTLDYERARFFACRWSPQKAVIYKARVALEDIIYYTDEREEKEVIIRPIEKGGKLIDLSSSEVSSAEYYNGCRLKNLDSDSEQSKTQYLESDVMV